MERGSFQPSVNERVYRGLQQRLHEIERILREDVTVNELTRAKNLLHIFSNHTANLQTALSQECWRRTLGEKTGFLFKKRCKFDFKKQLRLRRVNIKL